MADCYARVIHNFEGSRPEELSVKQGDVIKVLQYLSNQWLDAELCGNTGLVPVNYTEILKDVPEVKITDSYNASTPKNVECNTLSQVEALYDFEARGNAELSFPAGVLITITEDVDEVWFEGIYNGKTGLFPKNYVDEQKSAAKTELQRKPCARAIYPFVGESDSELTFKEGQVIFLRRRAGSQWMMGEVDGKTGLFPASFVNIEVDLPPESSPDTNTEGLAEKKNSASQKVQWAEGMQARVLYHFTALYSEDLELTKGDLLTVISVVDDVWVKGQLVGGRSGLCPSAYLEPVSNDGSSRKQLSAETSTQLIPTEMQRSEDARNTKRTSTEERHGGSGSGKSLSALDTSVTEDPSPSLKPVCAVSPIKRRISPPGQKPALKPKPVLDSPTKRTYSLSAKSRPSATKASDDSKNRHSSFSLNRGLSAKSASGFSEFSFDGPQGRMPAPQSPSSNRACLLDDTPTKDKTNLPSPLSPLSPGAPSGNLAPPKRRAPPPPRAKSNSKTSEAKASTPPKHSPGLTDINAKAVSPKALMPVKPAACKQQATILPNSHKQDAVSLDSVEGEVPSGQCNFLGVVSNSPLRPATHLRGSLSPPTVKRSTAKSRPTSVLYMGGESANQGKALRRISSSLEDLRTDEAEDSEQSGPSISPSELPELEQVEKDIAKTKAQLQKEEKVFSGMKTIMQLVMTNPSKQHELSSKVSRSQQKLDEWKEELRSLKAKKSSLVKSYYAKKLQDEMSSLEADLERQVQNKESLEALLDVVGESRKEEVQANLNTCLQAIQEITGNITDLKVSGESGSPENSESSRHQRRAEQRQKIVREIISTERAYQRDLKLCVEYFLTALTEDKEAPELDCDVLFGNIQAVLEASVKLLPSLERAVEGKEANDQELGKCFVDISEEMKLVYANYCRNHDEAIALMEKYEEIPEVQAAFAKCLERAREHTKCWDLSSFLIKPVQRVLKYPLLLSELLKYTPEIHKDKENLLQAVTAMTDVANAINEFKRRKDLVVKYKRVEESGLGTMMQKLSWHSVVKKSSRFNQRITQFTGLVSQTVDDRFNEEEKRIRSMEKAIKAFVKDVSSYLDEFRAASLSQFAMGDNITNYYQEAATCTEVMMYIKAHQRIGDHVLFSFENRIHQLVLSPLNALLGLFQGPQRLIQKRHDKCLDYDSWSNKIEKIKDREKLKLAKEELEVAKKNYEALNSQLLVDLPEFYQKALALMKECVRNFGIAQKKFYAGVLEEYIKLMQSPLIQSTEGDIVEQQAKKTLQVVEKFAELSFIPYSFVSKDASRKKKKPGKLPLLPSVSSNPPSPNKNRKNVESGPVKSEGTKIKLSPQKLAQERAQAPPQAAPRRKSNSADNTANISGSQQPELVDVSPAEGRVHIMEFSFEAQNAGELTVNKGDKVSVLRCSDSTGNPEWWLVKCESTVGYVPGNFLIPAENWQEDDDEEDDKEEEMGGQKAELFEYAFPGLYLVEFDFEASSPAELSISQGQMVRVLKMQDLQGNQEWWLVEDEENPHNKGYVPASYLTLEEQII